MGFGFQLFQLQLPWLNWPRRQNTQKHIWKAVPQSITLMHTIKYSIHLFTVIWLKSLWCGFWMACGSALQWTLLVGTDGVTRRKAGMTEPGHPHCHVRPDCSLCRPRASSQGHTVRSLKSSSSKREPRLKEEGEPSSAFNTNLLWKETNVVQRMGISSMPLSFRNDGPLCWS